jgi:NAD(P)-dependent dehydrogenase (short-subunit alcohol dehydrogenase family)
MDLPDLSGKTALVTGAGRGIGKATAHLLATAGARVVLTARGQAEIEAAAADIVAHGGQAASITSDVADPESVRRLFAQAGPIDILINNAGVIAPISPLASADSAQWLYNVAVNLNGVFLTCRHALPGMIGRGWGRIVNVSSGAARGTTIGWSAYSAAKAGVEALTGVLARELAGYDIRINAVRPGIVDTEIQVQIRASTEEQFGRENVERFHRYQESGMLRDPRDPARLIVWLLSPEADNLNGEVLAIDDPAIAARLGLQVIGR